VRAVLDTNVLVSGLLWSGAPHQLLEQVRNGALSIVTSPALLAELSETLARPKLAAVLARADTRPEDLLAALGQVAEVIAPPPLPEPISRDPDDDAVLALAVAAQADVIVSGDHDLLVLGSHASIAIIGAAEAVRRVIEQGGGR
jgi:uncharacterized protein